MFNRIAVLISLTFLLQHECLSQDRTIIPFTGIRYFSEGISAKSVEVRVDGSTLLNNRIPLNKEFEIRLQSATGFTGDRSTVFAAVEVSFVSMKGDVAFKLPNAFQDKAAIGFPAAAFKESVLKLVLKPEYVKTDPVCTVKLRYYDLKGKNQLRLEFPISIARPGEVLQTSKLVNDVKTTPPFMGKSAVVKIKNVNVTVDTSIRVNPKMAYASLDITGIEGSSISEILSGKESYWVYDDNLNEIKMTDKQLKQVGGAMEENIVNYLSKIPYRLKTVNKSYTVRFRWEGPDKRKVIDIVVTK